MIVKRVPPCGAAYFAPGGKVGKTPPGDAFKEHFACGGVPRRLSPGPPVYGGVSLWPGR